MAQKIKQANLFGRIGTGIGKGLAEQIPKEVENYRLRTGLKNIADQSDQGNLSPAQFLAQTSGTYGVTPQMIQSFSELAKIQNQGNAYKRGVPTKGTAPEPSSASPTANEIIQQYGTPNQQNQIGQPRQKMPSVGQVNNQQQTPNVNPTENIPQVVEGNSLNQQNLTRLPWKPAQRQASIASYIDQGFLPDQARQLQQDDEARDLAEPGAYKQRLDDVESAKSKVRDTLKRHLETKLQKSGEGVYKDVEGRMILNAERGMTRDLIKNPKADIDNVANDWSERLYNTAQAKGKMKTFGQTTGWENFLKGNSSEKKLKEYQDIFKRSGNLDEFKNILQGNDFGMSAQAAAEVAYPPNSIIDKKISKFRPSEVHYNPSQKYQEARKSALDVSEDLGPDDSVLSIVRKFSEKDPFFDQQAFLDQISEDKDRLGLNERQRLELAEGVRNILPNWADILYLPIFRR